MNRDQWVLYFYVPPKRRAPGPTPLPRPPEADFAPATGVRGAPCRRRWRGEQRIPALALWHAPAADWPGGHRQGENRRPFAKQLVDLEFEDHWAIYQLLTLSNRIFSNWTLQFGKLDYLSIS